MRFLVEDALPWQLQLLRKHRDALRGSDGHDTSALEEHGVSASSCCFQLGCKWIELPRQSSVYSKSQVKPKVSLGGGKDLSEIMGSKDGGHPPKCLQFLLGL